MEQTTTQPNKKTGTTTVAIKFKEGILLAADSQSTIYGMMRYSLQEEKIQNITDNIAVTGAGDSGEITIMEKLLKAEIKLFEVRTGRKPTVKETANLLAQIQLNSKESHFLLGGVDQTGEYTFDVMPGLAMEKEYAFSGSGSFYALSMLDNEYKRNMTEKEATDTAIKVISTSIGRDVFSGGEIKIKIITNKGIKDKTEKAKPTKVQEH